MDTDRNISDSPSPKMAAILSVYPYVIITEILAKYYRVLQLSRTELLRHVHVRERKEKHTSLWWENVKERDCLGNVRVAGG